MTDAIKGLIKKSLPQSWLEERRQYLSRRRYRQVELDAPGEYYSTAAFDYYKCIFVHIPKSAGVSISKTLFGNYGGGHNSIKDYQSIFPKPTFDRYFKFTFVRHPYTRLQSAYYFLKAGGMNEKDRNWSDTYLSQIHSFEEFILDHLNQDHILDWKHFKPQINYLQDDTEMLNIDFIGRYEGLHKDFDTVCNKIGIPNKNLKHENHTVKKFDKALSPYAKQVIFKVYYNDFKYLGYKPTL
jgi:hypothetical protein